MTEPSKTIPPAEATLVARVLRPGIGPCVASVRDGEVFDITSRIAPTCRDVCELPDPASYVAASTGELIGDLQTIESNSHDDRRDKAKPWLLAPCDLQVVKACGVTFAHSMIERVIEERAGGDFRLAEEIRTRIGRRIGSRLVDITPGTTEAAKAKQALEDEGLWSQYLEVGIGEDAEIFTKAPVLSSVGSGAKIGLHPRSVWNNPEPELVLICDSSGRIVGASLGNDVNLRDFEGRSALLLGRSKDNNSSSAIGPCIRLIDEEFGLDEMRSLRIEMRVRGRDGFELRDTSEMASISRDITDLAGQTLNANHAYPDGFVLYCGTPFAPTMDRDVAGQGFTHHMGDLVEISAPELGCLSNEIALCANCERWRYSASHLMRNLAHRELV